MSNTTCKRCGQPKEAHRSVGGDILDMLSNGGPVRVCPTAIYEPEEPEPVDPNAEKARDFLSKVIG